MPAIAIVNVDGRLVPPAEAVISIFDRGLLAGDLVYEVLRTYAMRPFQLGEHLARLSRSAERVGLPLPWDAERIARELARALEASRGPAPEVAAGAAAQVDNDPLAAPWNRGERTARILMTRGGGAAARALGVDASQRAIIAVQPLAGPPAAAYRDGVGCLLVKTRAPRFDPVAKTGRHLTESAAAREAEEAGAHEAILLNEHGLVTEGASSNVFVVKGGRLATPPAEAGILLGITRGLVLRLARAAAIPAEERALAPGDLAGADELFVTSTTREVLPVVRLGDAPVGGGRVGPVTSRLHGLFRELVARENAPR